MLTSELCLEEYTHFDLLLGVRLSSYRLQKIVAQWETGIGLLEEIIVSFRCPHRKSPPRGKRVPTTFPEGCWRKVFRLSNQTSRLPAAVGICFGPAGGRASEPDVARGEGGVWVIIQVCQATLACVSIRMLCITYYVFVTESVYMLVRVIAVIPCSTSSAGLRLVVQLIKSTENDNQYLFLGVETERLPLSTQAFRRISYTPVSNHAEYTLPGKSIYL